MVIVIFQNKKCGKYVIVIFNDINDKQSADKKYGTYLFTS